MKQNIRDSIVNHELGWLFFFRQREVRITLAVETLYTEIPASQTHRILR